MKNSRFHIWTKKEDPDNYKISGDIINLTDWLKKDFNLESDDNQKQIIEKYEILLDKYLKTWKENKGDLK